MVIICGTQMDTSENSTERYCCQQYKNQMDSIGKRIREERERLGLKQDQVGVAPKTQRYYESDERHPDAVYLAAFAEKGADVLYIITGLRTANLLSPVESELLAAYRAMDARGKGAVLGMATGYVAPPHPSLTISEATIGQVVQGDATGGGTVKVKPESKNSKKRR